MQQQIVEITTFKESVPFLIPLVVLPIGSSTSTVSNSPSAASNQKHNSYQFQLEAVLGELEPALLVVPIVNTTTGSSNWYYHQGNQKWHQIGVSTVTYICNIFVICNSLPAMAYSRQMRKHILSVDWLVLICSPSSIL